MGGSGPGVFFLSGAMRLPIRVLVFGVERTDYDLFFENGGQERVMVYFEHMSFRERCVVQIQHRER